MSNLENQMAIRSIESSLGDDAWTMRGPVVKSGRYKGEKAMGAFQVMPGNLPIWSKEALGREVSVDEFMANPDIQRAIFDDQWEKNVKKHGSEEDAVSVWFTGRALGKGGAEASDSYITGKQYVDKYHAYRGKKGGEQAQGPLSKAGVSGEVQDMTPVAESGEQILAQTAMAKEANPYKPNLMSELIRNTAKYAASTNVPQPPAINRRRMKPIKLIEDKPKRR